jgi:hypothetical protein
LIPGSLLGHRNRWLAQFVGDGKVQLDEGSSIGVKNPAGTLDRVCNRCPVAPLLETVSGSHTMGRGLLLWLLGIPIPVIILLYVFHVV